MRLHPSSTPEETANTPNFTGLEITCHDNSEPEKEVIATYLRCGELVAHSHYPTILEIGRLQPDPHTLHEILLQCPTLETGSSLSAS